MKYNNFCVYVVATMRISGDNYKANKGLEFPLIESKTQRDTLRLCYYVVYMNIIYDDFYKFYAEIKEGHILQSIIFISNLPDLFKIGIGSSR